MARHARKIDHKRWDATLPIFIQSGTVGEKGGATNNFTRPSTILRLRGSWWAGFDHSLESAGDRMRVSLGVGIVSTDAAGVGAGSIPSPEDNIDWPWMFWDQVVLHCSLADQTGQPGWGGTVQHRMIDSKAMRKVKPNESLIVAIAYGDATGAPSTVTVVPALRMLIGE